MHQAGDGYGLTRIGRELGEAIDPLGRWAKRWRAARRADAPEEGR